MLTVNKVVRRKSIEIEPEKIDYDLEEKINIETL